jgi:hypothetical protein
LALSNTISILNETSACRIPIDDFADNHGGDGVSAHNRAVDGYEQYNYTNFSGAGDNQAFALFQSLLHVGDQAPDFEAIRLEDGETVRLTDYTAEANVIVEFGSFT